MTSEIIYLNELDNLDIGEFKLNLNSLNKDKVFLDEEVFINNKLLSFKNKIITNLENNNFTIIKNFGTSDDKYIFLNLLISKKLYFSEKLDAYLYSFNTQIATTTLHEDLHSGGFHTDFSFQSNIPDFVSLQCLETDPKYPYLGRNYIANSIEIFQILIKKYNLSEKYLLNIQFPYTFGDKTIWTNPFSKINNKIEMKIHTKMIDITKLKKIHFVDKIPLNELINQLSLHLSSDFVLNKGDIAIFSNKYSIHKRGECSIDLINNKSRKLNSMRFFI